DCIVTEIKRGLTSDDLRPINKVYKNALKFIGMHNWEEQGVLKMVTTINDQIKEIEQFLAEVVETEEYKSVEYMVFSIRKPMLRYFTLLRNKDNKFTTPLFLVPLVNQVGQLFCEKGISQNN